MDEKSSFRPLTGQDLKEIWKRQRWWFVGTAVFLAAATCLVVGLLPSTYRSDALILIEQPAVSQDFVKPLMGVDDEQQISALVQQVLSRTLVERLPNTAIVSISHRSTLGAWHSRHLEMTASEGRLFVPRDARTEPRPQQVGAGRKV